MFAIADDTHPFYLDCLFLQTKVVCEKNSVTMAKKGTKVTNRITKKQLLELLIDLFNRYPE